MTDTHTHLYISDSYGDGREVVERAISAGVDYLIFPNVDSASVAPMMKLHGLFPENTGVAMGIHPTELGPSWREELKEMAKLVRQGGFIAIGETGIDRHWDDSNVPEQKEAFGEQLRLAAENGLPVIIHCRDGVEDTLDVISSFEGELPILIFHSFTSGLSDVRKIREVCDPYFGINGVVTFKNARELREALPEIGLDRIVLETDAPWLAPTPHRGTTNESAYIPLIRDKVAEVLGKTPAEVEDITDHNANAIFKIRVKES